MLINVMLIKKECNFVVVAWNKEQQQVSIEVEGERVA